MCETLPYFSGFFSQLISFVFNRLLKSEERGQALSDKNAFLCFDFFSLANLFQNCFIFGKLAIIRLIFYGAFLLELQVRSLSSGIHLS